MGEHNSARTVEAVMLILCTLSDGGNNRYPALVWLLGGLLLNGCATTQQSRLAQSHLHTPLKILVLDTPLQIEPGRLQKVFAPDAKQKLSLSDAPISQAVAHSRQFSFKAISHDLTAHSEFIPITPSASALPILEKIQAEPDSTKIPQDVADQLHSWTGADALLRYRITDYGLTPQTWRTGYISFEVVSTLAITALIASTGTTLGKGAAGAYLVQETAEESAESYAGFWALDEVCRPVRIEAELIQLEPVTVVWKGRDTGLSDVHLSRLTRKVDTQELELQLEQSTDYSVNEVVSALVNDLQRIHSTPQNFYTRYQP